MNTSSFAYFRQIFYHSKCTRWKKIISSSTKVSELKEVKCFGVSMHTTSSENLSYFFSSIYPFIKYSIRHWLFVVKHHFQHYFPLSSLFLPLPMVAWLFAANLLPVTMPSFVKIPAFCVNVLCYLSIKDLTINWKDDIKMAVMSVGGFILIVVYWFINYTG